MAHQDHSPTLPISETQLLRQLLPEDMSLIDFPHSYFYETLTFWISTYTLIIGLAVFKTYVFIYQKVI